jgi:hypothetical protein
LLDSQIFINSCDTGSFYSKHEENLHLQNHKLRNERKQLLNGYTKKTKNGKRIIRGIKDIEKDLTSYGLNISILESVEYRKILSSKNEEEQKAIVDLHNEYLKIKSQIEHKREIIKKTKNDLLQLLENKTNENIKTNGKHHIRKLRNKGNKVSQIKEISVFESDLTRLLGNQVDKLSNDFIVIQVYYFQILHDILLYGFDYNGEKYVYFTSSAGQIRQKKAVFIKETALKQYSKTIMCGLSVDMINKMGGNNPNKHLAYLALVNSATDIWEEFDIDKTIVVDDFETEVYGEVDFINDKDFSITRKNMNVPIPHTDGCGIMLPNAFGKKQKNMMVRLPWIKGLLGVFDYYKFIEINNGNPVIKDIYGKEHDVIKEDIQVIFTKSQFKMNKYYSDWSSYQENFKRYKCHAGFTNPEEDRIKNATINYQMLQSLVDITDEEVLNIAHPSIDTLQNIASSVEGVKNVLGITPYNMNKTYFQKATNIYPELLNDVFIKNKLRDIKDSLVKHFKAGKLKINGKYTFILPDLYATCEYWFLNNRNPKGLLDNGEVFCWLYRKAEKLDCLRSPHLFMEHAVRNNIACTIYGERQQKIKEWFNTSAIYTSCHDLITKIVMADCDGDKLLVVADKTIIKVAERNIKKFDIVPLYYEMKKALSSQLDNEKIYQSLVLAFTSAPIGLFSNNISKVWNSDVFVNGTYEEQKHAIDCIKRLCCQNNMIIDYAKTLYKPEFPRQIKKDIQKFTKQPLPYFFVYAKDKLENQVQKINNTFVNRLYEYIPNPRIRCTYMNADGKRKALAKPDYHLLMSNPDLEIERDKANNIINPVVLKYTELATKYGYKINAINEDSVTRHLPREVLYKSQLKQNLLFGKIYDDVKIELSKFKNTDEEITDILVKYLYDIKDSKNKDLLWACYGEYLYNNLKQKVKSPTKEVQCIDCGEWFEVLQKDNQSFRCSNCYQEYRRKYKAQKERERRQKIKEMSNVDSTNDNKLLP